MRGRNRAGSPDEAPPREPLGRAMGSRPRSGRCRSVVLASGRLTRRIPWWRGSRYRSVRRLRWLRAHQPGAGARVGCPRSRNGEGTIGARWCRPRRPVFRRPARRPRARCTDRRRAVARARRPWPASRRGPPWRRRVAGTTPDGCSQARSIRRARPPLLLQPVPGRKGSGAGSAGSGRPPVTLGSAGASPR